MKSDNININEFFGMNMNENITFNGNNKYQNVYLLLSKNLGDISIESKIKSIPCVYFDYQNDFEIEKKLKSITFYCEKYKESITDFNSFINDILNDEVNRKYLLEFVRDYSFLYFYACGNRSLFYGTLLLTNSDSIAIINYLIDLLNEEKDDKIDEYINKNEMIDISPFPTKFKKLMRYFDKKQIKFPKKFGENFICKGNEKTSNKFYIGYINPQDQSFHNFENIINLDSYFNGLNFNCEIHEFKPISNDIFTFSLKHKNKDQNIQNLLLEINKMNLYNIPFNNSQRGGSRFIFSSSIFSDGLSESFREISKSISNKEDIDENYCRFSKKMNNFSFVNSVFRYNKFEEKDKKFKLHYDTPYYSKANNEISRYSLLMYLTPGYNDDFIIKFKTKLNFLQYLEKIMSNDQSSELGRKLKNSVVNSTEYINLEEMAKKEFDEIYSKNNEDVILKNFDLEKNSIFCILFDHSIEHEAMSYLEGNKIFIRTELVFKINNDLDYNEKEKRLFNIACYMAKQSLFNSELENYTNECFNLSTKHKLTPYKNDSLETIFIHKKYKNINFVTNGHDYFFPLIFDEIILAGIVLVDYFNCLVSSQDNTNSSNRNNNRKSDFKSFNRIIENKIIKSDFKFKCTESIFEFLHNEQCNEINSINSNIVLEMMYYSSKNYSFYDNNGIKDKENCCPYHHEDDFLALKSDSVITNYNDKAKLYMNEIYSEFGVICLGEKIVINLEKMKVNNNQIKFEELLIPNFHFAGCDYQDPPCWDGVNMDSYLINEQINGKGFSSIPPITFIKTKDGYQYKIDVFNNNYIYQKDVTIKTSNIVAGKKNNE